MPSRNRMDRRCVPGKLKRWCRSRHRKKSWGWIRRRYFPDVNGRGGVFSGESLNTSGARVLIRLMRAREVRVVRWPKIRSDVNPYDPAFEEYLEDRTVWKWNPTLSRRGRIGYLWNEQGGKCVVCGQFLRVEEQPWHVHHRVWRCHGGRDTFDNLELLHANCHRQVHARTSR